MIPRTRRDDFPATVVNTLSRRVGMRCSMPDCRQPTSGPQVDEIKAVNVGVAAHITAAAPGGPRFDSALTPQQRRAAKNGIWLCQNHAKLIDNDAGRYTVNLLRQWKQEAENAAHREVCGDIIDPKQHLKLELRLRINVDVLERKSNLYWKLKNTSAVAARQYQMIICVPHDLNGRPFYFDENPGVDVRLQRDDTDSPIYWRLVVSNSNQSPIFGEGEAAGNIPFRQALPKLPRIPTIPEVRFQIFADDMPTKKGVFELADISHTFNSTPKMIG